MNIAEDCRFAYTVSHEAWYAESTSAFRDEQPELMVASSATAGGVAWEFSIREHTFNQGSVRTAVQVCMFDDAFAAWSEVPELFEALRIERPTTLDTVRAILDRLGATDETDRVGPYGGKTPEQMRAAKLRAQAAEMIRKADGMDPARLGDL